MSSAVRTPPLAITGRSVSAEHLLVQTQVGPVERAVARDRGHEVARRARLVERGDASARASGPSSVQPSHHHVAAAHVDRDERRARRTPRRRGPRTAGSSAAAVPRIARAAPSVEHRLDVGQRAHAAADLHRDRDRVADVARRPRGSSPCSSAASRSTTCSRRAPSSWNRVATADRVVGVGGLVLGVAAQQPDGAAAAQVDRRDHDHAAHLPHDVGVELQPGLAGLLRVELRREHVVARHDRGERAPVLGRADRVGRRGRARTSARSRSDVPSGMPAT